MKKKVLMVVLALVFSLVFGQVCVAAPSSSTKVDGGFVSATFEGGSIYGTIVYDDFYFNNKDAVAYANRISVSSAEAVAWAAGGFIPIIGPSIAVTGAAVAIVRSQAVTDIRELTDEGKKVHVACVRSNGSISFSVSEWNGTYGQIKSSLDWAANLGVTFSSKFWKIGTQDYRIQYGY